MTASSLVSHTVSAANPARLLPGRKLKEVDGWRLVGLLGSGGMGAVYLAEKPQGILSSEVLYRRVALKTFDVRLNRKRIAKEIKAQSDFNHPNLVHYLGHGTYRGVLYLLMNYVQGSDAWRLAFSGRETAQPFALPEACAIAVEVAKGLSHIHRKAGFVHRDVKPANILISDEGSVILGDLGLADISGGKDGGGTPGFVAPEQAQQQDTDYRADVYSLGCTLHFFLTGEAPFDGVSFADPDALLKAHLDPDLVAKRLEECCDGIPPALGDCVAAMLAKDREQRPSCPEVIQQLRPFTGHADIQKLYNSRRSGPETLLATDESLGLSKSQLPVARVDRRSILLGLSAATAAIGTPMVLDHINGDAPFEELAAEEVQVPGTYRLLNNPPTVLTRNKGRWAEPEFLPQQLVIHAGDFCMVELGTLDMAHTPNFRFEVDLDVRGGWNGSVGLFFGCNRAGDTLTYHMIDLSDHAAPIIQPALVYHVVASDLESFRDEVLFKVDQRRNIKLPNFNFVRRLSVEANRADHLQRISLMPDLDHPVTPPDGDPPIDLSGGFGVFSRQVNAVFTQPSIQFLD